MTTPAPPLEGYTIYDPVDPFEMRAGPFFWKRRDDGTHHFVLEAADYHCNRQGVVHGLEDIWLKKDGSTIYVRESARAALMTRGFAEMSRLAEAMGAEPETLIGLSGFGDLVLTCTSPQSRNFAYGYGLGKGEGFATTKTVEGIATAKATVALAQVYDQDLPVARTVAAVIEEKMTIKEALNYLMSRPLKKES